MFALTCQQLDLTRKWWESSEVKDRRGMIIACEPDRSCEGESWSRFRLPENLGRGRAFEQSIHPNPQPGATQTPPVSFLFPPNHIRHQLLSRHSLNISHLYTPSTPPPACDLRRARAREPFSSPPRCSLRCSPHCCQGERLGAHVCSGLSRASLGRALAHTQGPLRLVSAHSSSLPARPAFTTSVGSFVSTVSAC